MIRKIKKDQLILLDREKLSVETIIQNNAYSICFGDVEQYVLDANGILEGVITSDIIKKHIDDMKEGKIKVEELIDSNMPFLSQMDDETLVAESILNASKEFVSLPVVNRNREFQYVYRKETGSIAEFAKIDALPGKSDIKRAVSWAKWKAQDICKGCEAKLLTDLTDHGMDYSFFQEDIISEADLPNLNRDKVVVLIAFKNVFRLLDCGRQLIDNGIRYVVCNIYTKDIHLDAEPYFKLDRFAEEVIAAEAGWHEKLFDYKDFQNLCQILDMTKKLEGDYVEIGTYQGDSARIALSYMEKKGLSRESYFLDTFEGYNEDIVRASDCWVGGLFKDSSMELVKNRLKEFSGYHLVKTDIVNDELPEEIHKIAVGYVDIGTYETEYIALNKIKDKIVSGGMILAENYGHVPHLIGAHLAVDCFMEENEDLFWGIYLESGQYLIVKK